MGDTNVPADGLAFGEYVTIADASTTLTSVDIVVDADKSVVFSAVNPGLTAGVATSIFALGSLDAGVASVATTADDDKLYLGVATEVFATVGVRFVHAFPADAPVDIWYSTTDEPTTMVVEDVPFGTISDHIALPATTIKVWVALTGTTTFLIDGAEVVLAAGGDRLTLVVQPNLSGDAAVAIVNDATLALVEPAAVKVTAVHSVVGAPEVSLKVKDADELLAADVAYGTSTVAHLATPTTADEAYNVTLQVVVADDVDSVVAEIVATLNRGTEVLVVLAGNATDESEAYGGAQYFVHSSGISYVRAVHAAHSAPDVRFAIDYETYGSATYKDATAFVPVSAGEHTVQLVLSDGAAAATVERECTVGAYWSVIAHIADDALAVWNLEVDPQTPAAGTAHVLVGHAAEAPAVEVRVDDAAIGSIATGSAITYTPLPAGSYAVDLVLNGTDTVAFTVDPLTVAANVAYSALAMGSAEDDGASALTVVAYADGLVRDDSKLTATIPIPDDGEGEGEGEGEGDDDDSDTDDESDSDSDEDGVEDPDEEGAASSNSASLVAAVAIVAAMAM